MDARYRENRLFAGVPPERLASLDLRVTDHAYQPGEVLFAEGAPGKEVFLVTSGQVAISKVGRGGEQEVLDVAGPGDFIGEMAVIDGGPRSARATAEGPTSAGVVDVEELRRALDEFPAVALNIGRAAIDRLRHTNENFITKLLESERLSLLGRMMGAIVHDFRNPIAVVLQATHYLKGREDDPMIPKLAGVVEESVNRMLRMTQELLDFSRGVSRVDLEEIDVEGFLESIVEECRPRLEKQRIEVVRRLGYTGPFTADRHRFLRLLLNMVKNAEEAMPEGGTLTLLTDCVDGQMVFRVGDTGCGMPEDVARRVFESFVTHGKEQGTGLGMAIAKSVVDAHRGRIWVESVPGEGTTFHISVPLEQPTP